MAQQYLIPTGPNLPVISDVTITKAQEYGWTVTFTATHPDGRKLYVGQIMETQGPVHTQDYWSDVLTMLERSFNEEKSK